MIKKAILGNSELDELQHLRLVGAASYTPPRAGDRPSHRFGLGYDFADFHRYQPGDRLQHIDWTRYCLSGGHEVFVRKYYEELSAENAIILDASRSMDTFVEDDKFQIAIHLAFLLLYAAAAEYESADLVVLGGKGITSIEPEGCTIWSGLQNEQVLENLEIELGKLRVDQTGAFERLLVGESALRFHYGSIILISDMFAETNINAQVLEMLADRTSRLHVIQLIGALDRQPLKKAQDVEWYDIETGEQIKVHYDPEAHRVRVDGIVEGIRNTTETLGANHVLIECPRQKTYLTRVLLDGEVLEET